MTDEPTKFWALVHPGGVKGIVTEEPAFREQDEFALPTEGYVVAFFPKITSISAATLQWPRVVETLSQTPEAAIVKFMDGLASGCKWEEYQDAGHKVRRVRVTDLGDPPEKTD